MTSASGATRRTGTLLVVAIAAVATLALACGGGGDRELTAEQAETIALAALLTESDLPNADWTVTDDAPEEPGDDDLFASVPACRELSATFDALSGNAADDDLELASHSRAFESAVGELVTREVESSVTVNSDPESVADILEGVRLLFTPDAIRPCFEAGFVAAFEEQGVSVTKMEITVPEFTLRDSAAIAVDLKLFAVLITFEMHMEIHVVVRDEIGGLLTIFELNSELLRANQRAILEAFDNRLTTALEAARE